MGNRPNPLRKGATPASNSPLIDRLELLTFASAIVLVTVFHVRIMLNAGALWRDEVSTLNLACKPTIGEFWNNLVFDPFPALYFLTVRVWVWTGLGGADLGLRALGLLIGLSIIAALFINGRFFGIRFPFVSLLLLGFNPLVIRWTESLRAYGLGTLSIMISFGLIWRMVEKPSVARVVLAGFSAILSVQCTYQNAILLAAIGLGIFAVSSCLRDWRPASLVTGLGLSAALSLTPYIPVLRETQEWKMLNSLPLDFAQLWEVLSGVLGAPRPFMVFVWSSMGVLSVLMAVSAWRKLDADEGRRNGLVLFAAVAGAMGMAGVLMFLRIVSFAPQVWYYVPLLGFAAVGIEGALAEIAKTPRARLWLLGMFVFLAVILATPVWRELGLRQTNVDVVAAAIAGNAAPGDLVLVAPWYLGVSFQRYYKGSAPWSTIPEVDDHTIHRWDQYKQRWRAQDAIAPVLRRIETTLKFGGRVWFIGDVEFFNESVGLEEFTRIRSHASQWEPVSTDSSHPVSRFENLQVQTARGWIP